MPKTLTLLLAVAVLSAHAEFAWQFRAGDIQSDGSWPSFAKNIIMTPVHSSNGWVHVVANRTVKPFGAVSFETTPGGTPSPFAFDRQATQEVSHAFVVVYADSPSTPMATLISAPTLPLMLEPDTGNSFFDTPPASREFIAEFYGETGVVELDGDAPPLLSASPQARLVHCHWETPTPIGKLFVGNSPVNAGWKMEWTGSGVAEIILAGELGGASINAVKRYVSAAYGIRGISYSDSSASVLLRRLGLDNSVFGTVTIVR